MYFINKNTFVIFFSHVFDYNLLNEESLVQYCGKIWYMTLMYRTHDNKQDGAIKLIQTLTIQFIDY